MLYPIVVKPEIVSETFFAFDDIVMECFRCTISGDEWRTCSRLKRWSDNKPGAYGRGLANTKDDKRKVTRLGCLGEMGIAKIFNLPFDNEFREKGDKYDFLIHGESLDSKLSRERRIDETGFVMCRNEEGIPIPISKDRYIFGYLQSEDKIAETATVVYCGWQTKAFVESLPETIGKIGDGHYNKEVKFKYLFSMQSLYDWAMK